ncbi:DUF2637 domain-containing protein [Parasphingorhabdus pacifica]
MQEASNQRHGVDDKGSRSLSIAALLFVAMAAVMGWGASFVGLHEYGMQSMAGFDYWSAWLVPATFDGAAFACTLMTYRSSINGRSAFRGRVLMWAFTAVSSWINWIHQPSPQAQIVAAGLPIAAVAVFDVVLTELRADHEARHGKRGFRLRPGLLFLRWLVDRSGTRTAFRKQVMDIPVEEIAGLGPMSAVGREQDRTAAASPAAADSTASQPETAVAAGAARPKLASGDAMTTAVDPEPATLPGSTDAEAEQQLPTTNADEAEPGSGTVSETDRGEPDPEGKGTDGPLTTATRPGADSTAPVTESTDAAEAGLETTESAPAEPEQPAAAEPDTHDEQTIRIHIPDELRNRSDLPDRALPGRTDETPVSHQDPAMTIDLHEPRKSSVPERAADLASAGTPTDADADRETTEPEQDLPESAANTAAPDQASTAGNDDTAPTESTGTGDSAQTMSLPPVPDGPLTDADKRKAARNDYRTSVEELDQPVTGAQLGRRYGLSEKWGRRQINAVREEMRREKHPMLAGATSRS